MYNDLSAIGAFRRIAVQGVDQVANMSVTCQWSNPFTFEAARFIYMSYGSSYTVDIAKAAAGAVDQENGLALTWLPILFSGAGSVVVPASSGAGSNIVPGIAVSDILTINSIPRTDGGIPYLLQTRSYSSGISNYQVFTGATYGDIATLTYNAEQYGSRQQSGDQVTVITSQIPARAGGGLHPQGVIFYGGSNAYRNILVCGDSLQRGQGSTGGYTGAAERGKYLSGNNPWRIIYNVGQSGQTHTGTYNVAMALLPVIKPDILYIQGHSINDLSAAAFQLSWIENLRILDYCKANNIAVIFTTCGTRNSILPAENTNRKALNQKIRSLEINGLARVVDVAALMDNPFNDSQINPIYDSGDNLHYNDLGYITIAQQLILKWQ